MGLIDQFHAKQRELDERARRALADQGAQPVDRAVGRVKSMDRAGREPRTAAKGALGDGRET
ncbi:hypothetical protein [Streptomyces olivaceiscleroticus]|uniref:Uncharacterized protein n=1 Tax=Streptomyces olivaceiscleroticus TaxID=68245 RepID=A0ABP3KSX8_9ACTN